LKVLLDTHVVLAILRKDALLRFPSFVAILSEPETLGFVSIATLWEIAIKTRLGKLDPGMPLENMVSAIAKTGLDLLQIEARHVITAANPEPETRDPFDRLLLAQCQVEGLCLATVDGALVGHPVALQVSGR